MKFKLNTRNCGEGEGRRLPVLLWDAEMLIRCLFLRRFQLQPRVCATCDEFSDKSIRRSETFSADEAAAVQALTVPH